MSVNSGLSDGGSELRYRNKRCDECSKWATLRICQSEPNKGKLMFWCAEHRFGGWCSPTNEMVPAKLVDLAIVDLRDCIEDVVVSNMNRVRDSIILRLRLLVSVIVVALLFMMCKGPSNVA